MSRISFIIHDHQRVLTESLAIANYQPMRPSLSRILTSHDPYPFPRPQVPLTMAVHRERQGPQVALAPCHLHPRTTHTAGAPNVHVVRSREARHEEVQLLRSRDLHHTSPRPWEGGEGGGGPTHGAMDGGELPWRLSW